MDDKNFIRQLETHQKELTQLIHRRLPILIGRMAKDHFQNNFRLHGFLNNGLTPWTPSHPKYDPNNPNKRKHPETEYFLYYSLKIGKKKYWANVKMHKDYGEVLYTIEKKKPDDLTPGLKQ